MVALLLFFATSAYFWELRNEQGHPTTVSSWNTLTTLFRATYTFSSLEVKRKQHLYLFGHPRNLRSGGTSSLKKKKKTPDCRLSSQGNLGLFEITRVSVLFSQNFRCNLKHYESKNFTDSFHLHIFEYKYLGFPLFYQKQPNPRREM